MIEKEEIRKIYEESLGDWPMAGDAITGPYKKMKDIEDFFEEYITAVQEDAFAYGFECALKVMGGSQA